MLQKLSEIRKVFFIEQPQETSHSKTLPQIDRAIKEQPKENKIRNVNPDCYSIILSFLNHSDRAALLQTYHQFREQDLDFAHLNLIKKGQEIAQQEWSRFSLQRFARLDAINKAISMIIPAMYSAPSAYFSWQVVDSINKNENIAAIAYAGAIATFGYIAWELSKENLPSLDLFSPFFDLFSPSFNLRVSKAPKELKESLALYNRFFPERKINEIAIDMTSYINIKSYFTSAEIAIKAYLRHAPLPYIDLSFRYKNQKTWEEEPIQSPYPLL